MEQYKKEFIEFMVDCQVLKFGDFVTKSGRKTPFFVNTGFYRTGTQLRRLGEYYAKAINDKFGFDFDVLFGPAYKGIPLTVAASMAISELYGKEIRYCSSSSFLEISSSSNPVPPSVTMLRSYISITLLRCQGKNFPRSPKAPGETGNAGEGAYAASFVMFMSTLAPMARVAVPFGLNAPLEPARYFSAVQ